MIAEGCSHSSLPFFYELAQWTAALQRQMGAGGLYKERAEGRRQGFIFKVSRFPGTQEGQCCEVSREGPCPSHVPARHWNKCRKPVYTIQIKGALQCQYKQTVGYHVWCGRGVDVG